MSINIITTSKAITQVIINPQPKSGGSRERFSNHFFLINKIIIVHYKGVLI